MTWLRVLVLAEPRPQTAALILCGALRNSICHGLRGMVRDKFVRDIYRFVINSGGNGVVGFVFFGGKLFVVSAENLVDLVV